MPLNAITFKHTNNVFLLFYTASSALAGKYFTSFWFFYFPVCPTRNSLIGM